MADHEAGRLINAVLDGGINHIDTSPDYGRREELIGEHLGSRRDEYFLATKCGCLIETRPPGAAEPARLQPGERPRGRGAEAAPAPDRPPRRRAGAMSPSPPSLEENGTVELVRAAARGQGPLHRDVGHLPNLADHLAMGVFDAFQIPYSAVELDHEGIITRLPTPGAGNVIRGGAARGAASAETNWRAGRYPEPGLEQRNWRPREARTCSTRRGSRRWSSSCASRSRTRAATTIVGTASPAHLGRQHRRRGEGPAARRRVRGGQESGYRCRNAAEVPA